MFKSMLMLGGLMLMAMPALADEGFADLFVDEAPVADEGNENRNAALAEMLSRVLVRVSGNPVVAGQPAAGPVLRAAPSLVQEYRYRTVEQEDGVTRVLWARFDQAAVERMMRENGLPVWRDRPVVLMWLASDRRGTRALLNPDTLPEMVGAARQRAGERGMPILLPLMDLEDQAALSAADLWSGYQTAVRQASQRYPADAILSGRLTALTGDRWRGEWLLDSGGQQREFETPPQTLDGAVAFAIDQAQNLLAAQFAPAQGPAGGGVRVSFADVHDLAAYGRLVGILERKPVISSSMLRYANGSTVVFELRSRDGAEQLRRALDTDPELVTDLVGPAVVQAGGLAPVIDHAYRLVR